MRFATRVLLLQLATVAAVVAVSCVVFLFLGVQQLRAEAENAALNIARTIAADPQVRAAVSDYSADPGTPSADDLADGELQQYAAAITARTGTLFVVITDDHGIRLAHPDPALLGQEVSTDYTRVLAGEEVVTWERGTLGVSARAKVPVYPPGTAGEDGQAAVGEVSVGFEPASVVDDLPALALAIAATAAGALAIGVGASLLMRRRWEKLTLGLQPEELVALLQNRSAVFDGVGDGVLALDTAGVVQVCNRTAAEMLGLADAEAAIGARLEDLDLPPLVIAAVRDGTARDGVVVDQRVLYVDSRPVQRAGRPIGDVLIVRDRTALLALSERLESVRSLTEALRAQRHEFAGRLHVAAGLLEAGRVAEARDFLGEQLSRGPIDYAVPGLDLVGDAVLQALIGAKAIEAAERGVRLTVNADTALLRPIADIEDVATVWGNLVDNAVAAAVPGEVPRAVAVGFYGDGTALVLTVADSGPGVGALDPFARRPRDTDTDSVHGWGVGLPLARDVARRRGGDVWLIARGGAEDADAVTEPEDALGGAVFGARLNDALRGDDRQHETAAPLPPRHPHPSEEEPR